MDGAPPAVAVGAEGSRAAAELGGARPASALAFAVAIGRVVVALGASALAVGPGADSTSGST